VANLRRQYACDPSPLSRSGELLLRVLRAPICGPLANPLLQGVDLCHRPARRSVAASSPTIPRSTSDGSRGVDRSARNTRRPLRRPWPDRTKCRLAAAIPGSAIGRPGSAIHVDEGLNGLPAQPLYPRCVGRSSAVAPCPTRRAGDPRRQYYPRVGFRGYEGH